MTDNDTTTGAPGAPGVETAEEFAERLMGVMDWTIEMTTMIEQRDAAIDARARREERAAALSDVHRVIQAYYERQHEERSDEFGHTSLYDQGFLDGVESAELRIHEMIEGMPGSDGGVAL